MTADEVMELFRMTGALLEGHFVLTSGLHSAQYVEKFRVLERPDLTSRLCAEFARRFQERGIHTVVGPVTGGIILAFETARQLGVRAIFTERDPSKNTGGMVLRRGFTLKAGERVLVVEDILSTGRSIKEVLEVLRASKAEVVGVGVLVDRRASGASRSSELCEGGRRAQEADSLRLFDVPLFSLARLPIESYQPDACPLCRQGLPVVKPGSR